MTKGALIDTKCRSALMLFVVVVVVVVSFSLIHFTVVFSVFSIVEPSDYLSACYCNQLKDC